MENQTVLRKKNKKTEKLSSESESKKRRGRPVKVITTEEVYEHTSGDGEITSEDDQPDFPQPENPVEIFEDDENPDGDEIEIDRNISNVLDFLDNLDGGFDQCVTMHVYKYPINKPESMLGRDDRIKVGTMPLNPVTWEDDVHQCVPDGGYCYIEFRWNQDVYQGDTKVCKAGAPVKGVYRRYGPVPKFNGAPSAPQQMASQQTPATHYPSPEPMDYFRLQREAAAEARRDMMAQLEFFKVAFGQNNQPPAPQPPAISPRLAQLEEKLMDAAFEALTSGNGSAPISEKVRPSNVFDLLMTAINKVPPETIVTLASSLLAQPAAPANQQAVQHQAADAESHPIEPDAKEAEIVERYPLAENATIQQHQTRVLSILIEDLAMNAPVTETANAIAELFKKHPEAKPIFEMILKDTVDGLREKLLPSFNDDGQKALKNDPQASEWLGNLQRALQK